MLLLARQSCLGSDATAARHKQGDDYFVVFYGGCNYTWLPRSAVIPLNEDYESHANVKSRALQAAIDAAWKVGRRVFASPPCAESRLTRAIVLRCRPSASPGQFSGQEKGLVPHPFRKTSSVIPCHLHLPNQAGERPTNAHGACT